MKKTLFEKDFKRLTVSEKEQVKQEVRDIFKKRIVVNPSVKIETKDDQRQEVIPGVKTEGQLLLL